MRYQRVERARHRLQRLSKHLAPLAEGGGGELFEDRRIDPLGLRSRDELTQAISASGLKVIERIDTQPHHPKAQDQGDALHAARSREITSLWRLAAV